MTRKLMTSGFLLFAIAAAAFGGQGTRTAHRITPSRAGQIALHRYKGKLQGTPKLEHEDGRWQYEVLIRTGKTLKEINVDAATGKIVSVENTTAKEEAREAKATKRGVKGRK